MTLEDTLPEENVQNCNRVSQKTESVTRLYVKTRRYETQTRGAWLYSQVKHFPFPTMCQREEKQETFLQIIRNHKTYKKATKKKHAPAYD